MKFAEIEKRAEESRVNNEHGFHKYAKRVDEDIGELHSQLRASRREADKEKKVPKPVHLL